MVAKKRGPAPTFIILSEAWYAKATLPEAEYVDEVHVGFTDEAGETRGFALRWYALGVRQEIGIQIEMFDDAWGAFFELPELLELLVDLEDVGGQMTPAKFGADLKRLGFADVTPRSERQSRDGR